MHIKSMDGLRGIAALNVVVAHFIGAFCGAAAFVGDYVPLLSRGARWGTDSDLHHISDLVNILIMPFFSWCYGGRFAVLIFFVLSGYVLTLPYYNNNTESLKARAFTRYFRLNLPIAFVSIISYCMLQSGLFYNEQLSIILTNGWLSQFYKTIPSLSDLYNLLTYQTLYYGYSYLIPPIWTMKVEFIGSIFLLVYFCIKPRNADIILFPFFSSLIVAFCGEDSIYFLTIFAGAHINKFKISPKYNWLVFYLGLLFGSAQAISVFYDYLPNVDFLGQWASNKINFYTSLGSLLVVLSVRAGFANNLFNSTFFAFLGKISFPMYLIHMTVLCSLVSFLYIYSSYFESSLMLLFTVYLIVVMASAYLLDKYIDANSILFARNVISRFKF